MADKTIGQLVAATNVTPTDLFVLEQSGTAKKLTGQILENWLVSFADGHGGIQSIAKTSTQGLVDVYTITLADTTTVSFTVTNGKAISSVTTYYAVSSSGSTVPSSWSTTRQSMTSTNRYLWSYQTIAFNDGSSIDTVKTVIGVWGDKGDTGATGRGIVSLAQTSREPGQYTLYTFTMSDGTTETFYSYDGVGITGISKTSSVGLVDLYTISYSNGTSTEFTVTNAKSITSVTQAGSSGLTDVYTVAFNDGTSTTFNVRNGSSISSIEKTSTQGLVDVYTVSLTDGTSTTFTVTNAKSITRIEQTGGTHAAGTTDTYTIYFNDGDTAVFTVYNGTNGTGSVSAVDGIQPGGNQNVTLLTTGNGAPTTTTPGQLYQRYFDLSTQILYICIGVDTTTTPNTYSWAGTGVPVDASLSSSSENPVQNKVITAKVGTAALTTTATDLSGAVNELNSLKATLASPALTGTPTAPTASASTDNTQIATTAFANRAANNAVSTFVRPNLLDNWYFVGGGSQLGYGTFPINQRGQTSYTDSATGSIYTIDRWRIATPARALSINSDSISVTRNTDDTSWSSFFQYIESPEALKGTTLTLSALVKNDNAAVYPWITLRSDAGNIASVREASAHSEWTLLQATGTAGDSLNKLRIEVYPGPAVSAQGASIKIKAIKLEIGSEQTLAHQENGVWVLNEIPDYETELLRCKTSTADPSDTYANGSVEFGNNIGIVQNTNTATQNISKGQYVIWKGALYTASAAIASGATLSSSNLTAVTGGGLNNLLALLYNIIGNNAGAHNSIYRGRYLGSTVTAEQWSAISAGTFDDLYIGDYWTIGGINWRIAAFDYWLKTGDTRCTTHHAVIVPDSDLKVPEGSTAHYMNTSNITTGAYVGSGFYSGTNADSSANSAKADCIAMAGGAFGAAHILSHREYFANATTSGYQSAGAWYDSTVDIMNEQMVYGCRVFSNVEHGTNIPNANTIDNGRLPLFALAPEYVCNGTYWWLRDVVSTTAFTSVASNGLCNYDNASGWWIGVRPAFGIKA